MPRHLNSSGSRQKLLPRSGRDSQATPLLRPKAKSTRAVTESTSRRSVGDICTEPLRGVKSRSTVFLLAAFPSSPGSILFRRQLAARQRLAQFDRYESVAARLDATLAVDLASIPTATLFWREQLAAQYRRLLGCEFTERHVVRRELQNLLGIANTPSCSDANTADRLGKKWTPSHTNGDPPTAASSSTAP